MGHAGWQLVSISIAIAIAGQMGDVAESALKRRSGVKDSSNILPGHGGMFDRFDAMLGASLFLLVIGRIIAVSARSPVRRRISIFGATGSIGDSTLVAFAP